jgi:integrase
MSAYALIGFAVDAGADRQGHGHARGPIAAARNKALLLIGFAGALRRLELASMRFEDVIWHPKSITIRLPRSKTDQEARGPGGGDSLGSARSDLSIR